MGLEFSFDSKNYRKNLADSLREKRAENPAEAKELLEQERETLKYKVSEDIKKVLANIEAKHRGKQKDPERIYPKEIGVEEIKMTGSNGVEHLLELHTLDISDIIPDELKLDHDLYRLALLDSKLSSLDIGPNTFNQFALAKKNRRFNEAIKTRNSHELLRYYFLSKLGNEDRRLFVTDYDELSDEDKKKYAEIEDRIKGECHKIGQKGWLEYKSIIDAITEGSFSDRKMFAHVVGAYEEGYTMNLKEEFPEKYINLKNRYPHAHPDEVVQELILNVHDAKSNQLWFHAGGTSYDNSFKMILISNSESERFKKEVSGFHYSRIMGEYFDEHLQNIQPDKSKVSMDDKIKAATLTTGRKGAGIRIDFKREEPWLFIADWIVDPYHRRLYKIVEKQKPV